MWRVQRIVERNVVECSVDLSVKCDECSVEPGPWRVERRVRWKVELSLERGDWSGK